MARKRLNGVIRETIIKNALTHRFKKEAEELCAEGAKLAEKVYCQLYSEEDRKKMYALPEGWLPEDNWIKASFAGDMMYIYQDGREFARPAIKNGIILTSELPSMQPWRFWADRPRFAPDINFSIGDDVVPIFSDLWCKTDDMCHAISAAEARLRAVLNSVTTESALVKGWPELEPFLPKGEKRSNLPDVTRSELNKLLDLPVT